ncbi:MAG: molybdopterin-dependent oxidoreductase [Thermodesulfobacteriota bacterium]|nr:molybdopterin-dependent oxidoreductase [Thermodesulfobacteriota bacterium]
MTLDTFSANITRRRFIKTSAALGAIAAISDIFGRPVKTIMAKEAMGDVAEERWIPFSCNQCGMGPDPARALVVDGVVMKVEGDPRFRNKVPCPSLVCVKAQGLVQKLYNPYRVKGPMKRTNPKKGINEDPKFVEIDWDEALDILAKRLKEIRSRGVLNSEGVPRVAQASQIGPVGPSNEGHGWTPFWLAWGPTERLGGGGGIKCYHGEHVYGELWRRAFVNATDFRLCNYEIVFGRNQNASTVSLGAAGFKAYADARVRGMKHIHVSPDQNLTAAKADKWIPIRIKTDSAFLFAMINVILHEMDWGKICDIDFLKNMTNNPYLIGQKGYYIRDRVSKKPLVWDPSIPGAIPYDEAKDFALEGTYAVNGVEIGPDDKTYSADRGRPSFHLLIDHVKDYTPEWASRITDVSAETIRKTAREFVERAMVGATINIDGKALPHRPVSIVLGKGVNNGWGAYQCVWAQHVLLMLVGALEVPGGNLGCYSLIYKFLPMKRNDDGFPLSAILPTDREKWEWPPKTRSGLKTLTPLAGPGPAFFGAETLSWKSFVEPLDKWPSSVPDVFVFQRTDPVSSHYDSNLVRKGMERIPFSVSFAYTINDSNWYADLVLPEATDLECLQLESAPSGYKGAWEYRGWAVRQPIVKPPFNTRDLTDICTELADRLGVLPAYNSIINGINGLNGTRWELNPMKKYSVTEIVDRLCKSKTNGKHDLNWFKKNGAFLSQVSKSSWYLHVDMVEKKMRYQLPYQAEVKRAGETLRQRLHETGIQWWDQQTEEYTHALPEWKDFRKIYEKVYQFGPEYDMWLTCHRGHQLAVSHNADIPWIIEAGKDTLDVPGVLINCDTARKKGIKDGDRVSLESCFGKTRALAIVSDTVRPDTLSVCEHFGTKNPMLKLLGWPNMSETERLDVRLFDETGGSSDHSIVKIHKV